MTLMIVAAVTESLHSLNHGSHGGSVDFPQLNAYTAKVTGEFAGQAEAHAAACFAIDDNASSKPALSYHSRGLSNTSHA